MAKKKKRTAAKKTTRARARRKGGLALKNPPKGWVRAKAVRIRRAKGGFAVDIQR